MIDWVERGASIRLDLRSDGTTAGRFFVPGADEDGRDIDEDLVGAWTLSAEVVRLEHDADTVLRRIGPKDTVHDVERTRLEARAVVPEPAHER